MSYPSPRRRSNSPGYRDSCGGYGPASINRPEPPMGHGVTVSPPPPYGYNDGRHLPSGDHNRSPRRYSRSPPRHHHRRSPSPSRNDHCKSPSPRRHSRSPPRYGRSSPPLGHGAVPGSTSIGYGTQVLRPYGPGNYNHGYGGGCNNHYPHGSGPHGPQGPYDPYRGSHDDYRYDGGEHRGSPPRRP